MRRPALTSTLLLRRACTPRSHARATVPPAQQHARAAHKTTTAGLRSFPAWFVRGGTSNGLVIRSADLPPPSGWTSVLAPAMGSPDPRHGRQLDGMGSGVSSTSKLVVLSAPPPDVDAHVAYTFVQVGIRDGAIDAAGNCGNMSSVVGPAAWDMGGDYVREADKPALVSSSSSSSSGPDGARWWATLRLFNTNTSKVVEATFRVDPDTLAYCPAGDYVMDGVPGAQSPVTMSFLDPAGAKTGRALPTGRPVDALDLPDGTSTRASLVDVGNPGVFVAGADLGLSPAAEPPTPAAIEADAALKARLEALRRRGAAMMGMDPDTESVPKIVLLFPPSGAAADDVGDNDDGTVDIRCRAMSMGQAHKAVPLTLALCLGAAARMPGTLAWDMLRDAGRPAEAAAVRIAHPSGLVDVGTTIVDGEIKAAKLLRTARVLMKGEVFY
ncbi:hypothetical protein V2A60_008959 [Cordyceps javanica]|uniref:DUF453 domain-containing protein n=1 Tax=Cordyceps javanica TaxID=43265 RepID=A0A545UPJ2_9HYPO|nr:DUF453 domain-containing protein [Cordyceps javanica]TQW03191.1 DUF453 domain protein [Cordyceps javanica]